MVGDIKLPIRRHIRAVSNPRGLAARRALLRCRRSSALAISSIEVARLTHAVQVAHACASGGAASASGNGSEVRRVLTGTHRRQPKCAGKFLRKSSRRLRSPPQNEPSQASSTGRRGSCHPTAARQAAPSCRTSAGRSPYASLPVGRARTVRRRRRPRRRLHQSDAPSAFRVSRVACTRPCPSTIWRPPLPSSAAQLERAPVRKDWRSKSSVLLVLGESCVLCEQLSPRRTSRASRGSARSSLVAGAASCDESCVGKDGRRDTDETTRH